MKLFDSHAHITDSKFDAVAETADFERDGIDLCLTVGYDLASSRKAAELANKFDRVYAAVGIHPHSASELTDNMCGDLVRLVKKNSKIVAIGEIGLDYYRNLSPVDAQQRAVLRQIDIAGETDLPVIFHIRDACKADTLSAAGQSEALIPSAYSDMRKLIEKSIGKLKKGALLHCFSGDTDEVLYYTELEKKTSVKFYFSFSGAVTYKKSKSAEVIKTVPYDRLLIETDCPYLAPEPHRGKLNRPAYVYFVAERIAGILGKSVEEIAEKTRANGCRLFGIKSF